MDIRPQQTDDDEKGAVGDALQVTGHTHPRVLHRRIQQPGQQTEQKENETQYEQENLHSRTIRPRMAPRRRIYVRTR